jgi:anaerobic magnesium-protoporphyrin IX monomethyl ester cyclase
MQKKVLLVYPGNISSGFSFPMGLLYIARALIETGIEVTFLHMGTDTVSKLKKEDYLFVGISVLTGNMILNALEVARIVKEYNKDIPIVFGGVHPSLLPEETLKHELVDIVVIGEGEETVKELAFNLAGGKDLAGVRGVAYKDSNGSVIVNDCRPNIDINKADTDLPYHLFGEYFIANTAVLPIHTSRGCPYSCGFCYSVAFHKSKYRAKSASVVADEIEYFYRKFNIRKYDFIYEDEFFIDVNRVVEILQTLIKRGIRIRWNAFCRFNTFDQAMQKFGDSFPKLLKDSGCNNLLFGAEAGTQRLLDDIINKKIKLEQIHGTIDVLRTHQIPHRISFMTCFPTETERDVEAILQLIDMISRGNRQIAVGIFNLAPFPGTSIFKMLVDKFGYIPPAGLEAWGKFNLPINIKNITWMPREHAEKCYSLFLMSALPFYIEFPSFKQYKESSEIMDNYWPPTYAGYLLTKIQRIRFKNRYFKGMHEMKLYLGARSMLRFIRSFLINFVFRKYIPIALYKKMRKKPVK